MNPFHFLFHNLVLKEIAMIEKPTLKTRVSDAEFVNLFLRSKSAGEVAVKIGLKVESVAARANKLRKAGVNIPKFDRKKREVDVKGLNKTIEDLQGQQELFDKPEEAVAED